MIQWLCQGDVQVKGESWSMLTFLCESGWGDALAAAAGVAGGCGACLKSCEEELVLGLWLGLMFRVDKLMVGT